MIIRLKQRAKTKNLPTTKTKKLGRTKLDRSLAKAERRIAKSFNGKVAVLPSTNLPATVQDKSLNKAGDKRGIHNRDNPPSSDRMRRIRAMRNFFSKAMPKRQCNNCALSAQCPQFRADYECAFLSFFNSHKVENEKDLMEAMRMLVASNMQRLHTATMFETLSGGTPSTDLSESFAMLFQQVRDLYELEADKKGGPIIGANGGKSIISSLFGNVEKLVIKTGTHHKEISETIIDLEEEENGKAVPALGDSKKGVDLIREMEEDAAASQNI